MSKSSKEQPNKIKQITPPNKLTPEQTQRIKDLYNLCLEIKALEEERKNLPVDDTKRSVALYFKIEEKRAMFNKIKVNEPVDAVDKIPQQCIAPNSLPPAFFETPIGVSNAVAAPGFNIREDLSRPIPGENMSLSAMSTNSATPPNNNPAAEYIIPNPFDDEYDFGRLRTTDNFIPAISTTPPVQPPSPNS